MNARIVSSVLILPRAIAVRAANIDLAKLPPQASQRVEGPGAGGGNVPAPFTSEPAALLGACIDQKAQQTSS